MGIKPVFVAALVALAHAPGATAAPLFSPPMTVPGDAPVLAIGGPRSGGGGSPAALRVALGPDGQATVAWLGKPDASETSDMNVSERPPGGGAFSSPVKVGRSRGWPPEIARNDAGVRAIAWPMKLSVAPAGAGFGSLEDVPTLPPPPHADPASLTYGPMSVAVAPNGAVLVGYAEVDYANQVFRSITVLRRPDGIWAEPQVLDGDAGAPQVVADATGALHAMWSTVAHTTTDGFRMYVADAGPDGQFGPGRLVSNPDWRSVGSLVANRRGDLLVGWQADAYGYVIGATERPAGGDWTEPEVLYGGVPYGQSPTPALDDSGDAVLAWTNGDAFARSRAIGHGWSPTSTTFVRQGSIEPYAVAIDANGTGLIVSSACRSEGTVDTIVASSVPRAGALQPVAAVSPGVDPVSVPEVATDAYGNGLIVWLRGPRNEPSSVFASGYSAAPPDVGAFTAKRSAFGFKVSEPARVTITVAGRHRRAVQWSRVRRGKSSLPFRGRVRSLLAHHGRYTATIRARDAGPRTSRARTINFKR